MLLSLICLNTLSAFEPNQKDLLDNEKVKIRNIYYKVDQGVSAGRLLDQKMSNLHYTGFGGVLNFGRRAVTPNYIAEWNFLRVNFNYLNPGHGATDVYQPTVGLRYLHLRNLNELGVFQVHAGLQANLFADVRIASRLGNSFLYADIISEVRPQAKFSTSFHLLRQWNFDFSIAVSLIGVGYRFPEYGTSFMLSEDGGAAFSFSEVHILKPSNFGHFTTGIFLSESFGDVLNPNRFRIGYVWDYYSMKGNHELNVNNAVHQLVLEFYFKVN